MVIDRRLDDGAGPGGRGSAAAIPAPHGARARDERPGPGSRPSRPGPCGACTPGGTREAVTALLADALRGADARRGRGRRPRPGTLLTEQERVVLRLMRQHLTYKEIAQRLGVSWHTVRTHAQSILRKSGVHSRRDLDAWGAGSDAAAAHRPAAH